MAVLPALPVMPPAPGADQVAAPGRGAAGPDVTVAGRIEPAAPAEAEAFRLAHTQVEATALQATQVQAMAPQLPGAAGGAHGLFPDMASHIDQLSTEMNDWFKAPGPESLGPGAADPATRMQELYAFVSKQFMSNTMLSMKLNVTNQEMEAVSKDKDQLMRGGS